ncbi:MAG: PP2C family protein-serine/threonine phosphatase [Phycisphaerales bacterium]
MLKPLATKPHDATELAREFEGQTLALLRSRFLWCTGVLGSIALLMLLITVAIAFAMRSADESVIISLFIPSFKTKTGSVLPLILSLAVQGLLVAWYAGCFWTVRNKAMNGRELIRLSYALVAVNGVLAVVLSRLPGAQGFGLLQACLVHFIACCFLPWSPKQAILPLVPVYATWIILKLIVGDGSFVEKMLSIPAGALLALPAIGLCALRHTARVQEYERSFFYKRYRDVRRELVDARRIHESLFPIQVDAGPVRLHYKYEPMQQIGGDFLYVHRSDDHPEQLSVVLLDVTGHGVMAALTVNRIWGELKRLFAEHPNMAPGNVLHLLNRYAHLTLAPYGVYLTAKCVRIDAKRDTLEYASGGHPPAFLYRADGTMEELDSTATVLGACQDDEFVPEPRQLAMKPGDVLLLYTDGINEARGISGRLLGLDGLRKVIQQVGMTHPLPGQWAQLMFDQLEQFRAGAPTDDTIVVELCRPSAVATGKPSQRSSRVPVGV